MSRSRKPRRKDMLANMLRIASETLDLHNKHVEAEIARREGIKSEPPVQTEPPKLAIVSRIEDQW